jgi:hypothetical protein
MSYSTELRDALKADFGIDVLLERGTGTRDDPFVILPCPAVVAARTQLDLLRGLERGRGELWRLLRVEAGPELDPGMQQLGIEVVRFTPDQVIRERRGYYFDLSQVDGMTKPLSPVVWEDARTRFRPVAQLGWLHFDQSIDNCLGDARLDTTLLYSCILGTLNVYIYEPMPGSPENLPIEERRARELRMVSAGVRHVHPDAVSPWPVQVIGPFAVENFLIGKNLSVAGVASCETHFVKFRLSFADGPEMRDLMGATIQALADHALPN